MDSVAYLRRMHELKGDAIAALIAEELTVLKERVKVLEANQCKCPPIGVPGLEQLG